MASASSPRPSGNPRKLLIGVARAALVVGIFTALIASGRLDPSQLLSSVLKPTFFGVLLSQIGITLLNQGRWVMIVRRNAPVSLRRAWVSALRSQFTTLILPAVGGGDAVKLMSLREVPAEKMAGTLIADRVFALFGLALALVISIIGVFVLGLTDAMAKVLPWACLVVLGIACVLPGLLIANRILKGSKNRLFAAVHGAIERASGSLTLSWGAAVSTGMSMVSMLLNAAGTALALQGAGIAAFIVTPLVTLSSALPITPQGLGVAETTAEWLYSSVGISGGASALLVLRLAWVMMTLTTGLAWLVPDAPSPGQPEGLEGPGVTAVSAPAENTAKAETGQPG